MTQTFKHGDLIEGYGVITGSYSSLEKRVTVYICYTIDQGYRYFKRPL